MKNSCFLSFKANDFSEVDLSYADMAECNLENCIFNGARLIATNLSNVKLNGCNLRGATVDGMNLSELPLENVKMDIAQCIQLALSHFAQIVQLFFSSAYSTGYSIIF